MQMLTSPRNSPTAWASHSWRLRPRTHPMSNKLSLPWQDRSKREWVLHPSTTASLLYRLDKDKAFSQARQVDAVRWCQVLFIPASIPQCIGVFVGRIADES